MAPHDPSFPYRKPTLIGATALAALVGIAAPGQSIGLRLAAPFMALIAVAGGFLAGWLVLKFQALVWGRVAPGAIATLCLVFFYLFLIGTVLNVVVYPFMADDLRKEGLTIASFAAMIPAGLGAAAGAHRVYVQFVS